MNTFPKRSVYTRSSFVKWFRITEKTRKLNLASPSSNAQISLFKERAQWQILYLSQLLPLDIQTVPTMGENPSQAPVEYEINSQE